MLTKIINLEQVLTVQNMLRDCVIKTIGENTVKYRKYNSSNEYEYDVTISVFGTAFIIKCDMQEQQNPDFYRMINYL